MPTPADRSAPSAAVLAAADLTLAHTGLRLLIGINLFLHGLVRLPDLGGFARGMAAGFEGTLLPPTLALPMGYVIPFVEVILGAMLLLGLRLRAALIGSLGLMCMLTSGVCLQQNWSAAGSQLVYGLIFALLLATRAWSGWTVDARLARGRSIA